MSAEEQRKNPMKFNQTKAKLNQTKQNQKREAAQTPSDMGQQSHQPQVSAFTTNEQLPKHQQKRK